MAIQQNGPEITMYASATLASYQFHIMTLDTSGYVKLADDADDPVEAMLGVLQNKPDAAGEEAVIRVDGIAKVMCGEDSLTPGIWVTCDSSGHAVTAVAFDNALGICVVGGDDGDIIEVLLAQCPLGYPA